MYGDEYIRLPKYITLHGFAQNMRETMKHNTFVYIATSEQQKRSQIVLNSIMRAFVCYNILNGGVCYYSYLLYYYIDSSCDVVSIYNLE